MSFLKKIAFLICCIQSIWFPAVYADSLIEASPFLVTDGNSSAKFVTNEGGISVIEFSGDYNKDMPDGSPNRAARAVVAREFYANNPDNFDFLVVFTAFEFETDEALAFHLGVSNDVSGIGLPIYSNSNLFGSDGELKGYIDMASLDRYNTNPLTANTSSISEGFDLVLNTLAHETLHQWAAYIDIEAFTGRGDGHWNFFLDTDGSLEYGHDWRDNSDGTFTATLARSIFSPLDLYLMGLNSAEDVPDMFAITPERDDFSNESLPQQGITVAGTRQDYSIQDVIDIHGAREPSVQDSKKSIRYGFIYLTPKDKPASSEDLAAINRIRSAYSDRFSIMTGGKSVAVVHPDVVVNSEPGTFGVVDNGGNEISDTVDTKLALDWLIEQQGDDGAWQDKASTRIRDSSTVLHTINDFAPNQAVTNLALSWLDEASYTNTDSLARGLNLVPNRRDLVAKLLDGQNADGGWGVSAEFGSNVLDTSLAICALKNTTAEQARISQAISFVLARQNSVGGWGNVIGGKSSVSVTSEVLQALKCAGIEDDSTDRSIEFLISKGNVDGGFGDQLSSIHETATVLQTLLQYGAVDRIEDINPIEFLAQRQSVMGDWNGSVYATAMAIRAIESAGVANLKVVSVAQPQEVVRDGDNVRLQVILANDGNQLAGTSSLRFYLGDPDVDGVEFASVEIPALPAFTSVEVSALWDSYSRVGENEIFVVADADAEIPERLENDNVALHPILVEAPPAGVDLTVRSDEFIILPSSVISLPSQQNIMATVHNLGSSDANAVSVSLWLGDPQQDGELINQKVIDLPSRSSAGVSFPYLVEQAGRTTFTIVVDSDNQYQEIDEANNVASAFVETIDGVDLEVLNSDISIAQSPLYLNQRAVITVKIRNKGTVSVPNGQFNILIRNSKGETDLLSTQVLLSPGEEKSISVDWFADFNGISELEASLDAGNLVAETNEDNNRASQQLDVALATGANLTVNFSELEFSPNPGLEGLEVVLSAVVRNTGSEDVSASELTFYDGNPNEGGSIIGSTDVTNLVSSSSQKVQLVWPQIPDSSRRFIYAVADANREISEIDEGDNTAFRELNVLSLPDVAISNESIQVTPLFPKVDELTAISINIVNRGKQGVTDVAVIAYASPDNSGPVIASTQIDIPESGENTWDFSYEFPNLGENSIYIEVDPEQLVSESDETNNTAVKQFNIQDGDFYVSDRYLSPDSNGVKDTVEYVFNLTEELLVSVVVINKYEEEIAELAVSDLPVSSGSVIWDGKNRFGGLASDGQYTFAVKLASGAYQGRREIALDTNRSALSEAIDSEFSLLRNLSCRIGEVLDVFGRTSGDYPEVPDTQNILYGPDDQYVYFTTYFEPFINDEGEVVRTDDEVFFPSGLYRALNDGTNVVQLLGHEDIGLDRLTDFKLSPDGNKLALLFRTNDVYGFRLWSVNTDGSNLKQVTTIDNLNRGSKVLDIRYINNNEIIYSVKTTNYADKKPQLWKVEDVEDALPTLVLDSVAITSERVDWIVKPNKQGTHALLHFYTRRGSRFEQPVRVSRDLLDRPVDYRLMLLDFSTLQHTLVSDVATSHAWNPTGSSFAVGSGATSHIQVFDRNGQLLQNYYLPGDQFKGFSSEEISTLQSALNWQSPQDRIGRFSDITWSPDGAEFAFVYEDYIASVIYSDGCFIPENVLINQYVASAVTLEHGYSGQTKQQSASQLPSDDALAEKATISLVNGYSEFPDDVQLLFERYQTLDGIYVAKQSDASVELVAQTGTTNASFGYMTPSANCFLSGWSVPVVGLGFRVPLAIVSPNNRSLLDNQYGFPITTQNLPYIEWTEPSWARNFSRRNPNESLRTMRWLHGARELLISSGEQYKFDDLGFDRNSDANLNAYNQTVLLSLDNPARETRTIFDDRDLIFDESQIESRGIYPTNTGSFLSFFSEDRFDRCPINLQEKGYRQFQSLLNLTADLRVRRAVGGAGFLLEGSAVDKYFDSYQLDYADVNAPENWISITPASGAPVIDNRFTTWVPPYIGKFYVRLTVLDKAGNQRQRIRQVNNPDPASISGVFLTPAYFSPNGDGVKDIAELHFNVLEPVNLEVNIYNEAGNIVRSFTESYDLIGSKQKIDWNGRDDNGLVLADGTYQVHIQDYRFFTKIDNTPPQLADLTSHLFVPLAQGEIPKCDFSANQQIPNSIGDRQLARCVVSADLTLAGSVTERSLQSFFLETRQRQAANWVTHKEFPVAVDSDNVATASVLQQLLSWASQEYRFVATDFAGNRSIQLVDSSLKRDQAHVMSYVTNPGDEPANYSKLGFAYNEYGFGRRSGYKASLTQNLEIVTVRTKLASSQPIQFVELLYRETDSDNEFQSLNIGDNLEGQVPDIEMTFNVNDLAFLDSSQIEFKVRFRLLDQSIIDTNLINWNRGFKSYVMPSFGLPGEKIEPNTISPNIKVDIGTNIPVEDIDRIVFFLESIDQKDPRYGGSDTLTIAQRSLDPLGTIETVSSSYRPGGKIIRDVLKPNLRSGRIDSEKIYSMVEQGLGLIDDCGYDYSLTALVFHHGGLTPQKVSLERANACLELRIGIEPVLVDQCGAGESNQLDIVARISKERGISSDTEISSSPVLLVVGTPAVDENGEQVVGDIIGAQNLPGIGTAYRFMLDTTQLPSGDLPYRAIAFLEDGSRIINDFVVPIVHEAPVIDIAIPRNNESVCALDYGDSLGLSYIGRGFEVQGQVSSRGPDLLIAQPSGVLTDEQGFSFPLSTGFRTRQRLASDPVLIDNQDRGESFEDKRRLIDDVLVRTAPIQFRPALGDLQASGVLAIPFLEEGPASGEVSLTFEATNWSGAKVCSTRNFYLDGDIEGLSIEPSGAKPAGPGKAAIGIGSVISPNADGIYDTLILEYSADEDTVVNIDVSSMRRSPDGWEVDEQIAIPYQDIAVLSQTGIEFEWRGQTSDGGPLADGVYRISVKAEDTCGNVDERSYLVEVDVTPPSLGIFSPNGADAIPLQVRILGSVRDENPGPYQVMVSRSDGGFSLLNNGFGNKDGLLGEWNTYGAQGVWVIKLEAEDLLANKAEFLMPVNLPVRQKLISSHTTTEYFVSPNEDGRLDSLTIRTAFNVDVSATFEILDSDDKVIRSLAIDSSYPQGFNTLIWDGLDSFGRVAPDGIYVVQVVAQRQGDEQTELIQFELDNTPPVLDFVNLNDGYIKLIGTGQLAGTTSDRNFLEYDVSVVTAPEVVENIQLTRPLELVRSLEQQSVLLAELPSYLLDVEQEYLVAASASDMAGNTTRVDVRTVNDRSPPEILINAPETGTILNSVLPDITISGHVIDNYLEEYQVTIAPKETPESAVVIHRSDFPTEDLIAIWNIDGLEDGSYVVEVSAVDKGGLSSQQKIDVIIDNTPPEVEISFPTLNGYVTAVRPVIGAANDLNFAQYTLGIALGNVTQSGNYQGLIVSNKQIFDGVLNTWQELPADGEYTFRVNAQDAAGNQTTIYHPFIIDTLPPALMSLSSVELLDNDKFIDVNVEWQPNEAPDLAGYYLYRNGMRVNQNPFANTVYQDLALDEGEYTYYVTAVDHAGLESEPSNSLSIEIDLTPPIASIANPNDGQKVNLLVDIIGTAYSEDDFNEYRLFIGLDTNNLSLLKSSSLGIQASELAQWSTLNLINGATYLIRLEAEDNHGNQSFDQIEVTVDNQSTTAPENLQAVLNNDGAQVTWEFNGSEPDLLGFLLYRNGRVANASERAIGDLRPYAIKSTNFVDMDLADGEHNYVVYAIDEAGNVSLPSNEDSVLVNNRPPHAIISNVEDGEGFDETLSLVASSEDFDIAYVSLQYRAEDDPVWTELVLDQELPYGYEWDTRSLSYGNYEVRAVATDVSGLVDPAPQSKAIVKRDIVAPSVVLSVDMSVDGNVGALTWQASQESDLAGYNIYRSNCNDCARSDFAKLNSDLVTQAFYNDTVIDDQVFYYIVAAVDNSQNESIDSDIAIGIYRDTVLLSQPFVVDTQSAGFEVALSMEDYDFDLLNIELNLPDGQLESIVQTIAAPGNRHLSTINLAQTGVYDLSLTAQSSTEKFTASDIPTKIIATGKPSTPEGLMAQLASSPFMAEISWNANPVADSVIGYKVFQNSVGISEDLLVEDATAQASFGSGIDNTLPQSSSSLSWQSNVNPLTQEVTFQQEWATPRLVKIIELDWSSSSYAAADVDVLALINGEYVQVARSINSDRDSKIVIELPIAIPTQSIRIQVNAWSFSSLGGILNEMRVVADYLFAEPNYVTELLPDGNYQYSVKAVNSFGGVSDVSDPVTIGLGDVLAPNPVALSLEVAQATASLSWNSISDAVAYQVYRDGVFIARVNESIYDDVGLINGSYVYTVSAIDMAGNESAESNAETALINIALPTAPVDLAVVASQANQNMELSWQIIGEENPANYRVYRSLKIDEGFEQLIETPLQQIVDSNISIGKTYFYYVTAVDGFGNESANSNIESGLIVDQVDPAKPVISAPTDASSSYMSRIDTSTIVGRAEPNSSVYLIHQGLVQSEFVTASSEHEQSSIEYSSFGNRELFSVPHSNRVFALGFDFATFTRVLLEYVKTGWQVIDTPFLEFNDAVASVLFVDNEQLLISTFNGNYHLIPLTEDLSTSEFSDYQPTLPQNVVLTDVLGLSLNKNILIAFARVDQAAVELVAIDLDTQEVTSVPTAFDYRVSPNSQYVAYSQNVGVSDVQVSVLDVVTGVTSSTFLAGADIDRVFNSSEQPWSPDNSKILLAGATINGDSVGTLFDFKTDTAIKIQLDGMDIEQMFWRGSDGLYVTVPNQADQVAQLYDYHIASQQATQLEQLQTLLGNIPYLLKIDRLQRIFFSDADSRRELNLSQRAGTFVFEDASLELGDNYFSAVSLDSSRNESEVAEPILVTYQAALLPDYQLDLLVNPSIPLVEQSANIQIDISNQSDVDSSPVIYELSVIRPDSTVIPLASQAVGPMSARSSVQLDISWAPDVSGEYTFVAIVDKANELEEISESNNSRIVTVEVVENAAPKLEVEITPSISGGNRFSVDEDLSGKAIVTNPGEALNGNLIIEVLDQQGALVESIKTVALENLAYGSQLQVEYHWNTKNNFIGNYQINARLVDFAFEEIATDREEFLITENLSLMLGLRANAFSYQSNQDVLLTASTINQSSSIILQNAELTLEVSSSDGTSVYTAVQSIVELLPSDITSNQFIWNTQSYLAGDYTGTATLRLDGELISSSITNFEILIDSAGLIGEIALSDDRLIVGNELVFTSELENNANTSLTDFVVTYVVERVGVPIAVVEDPIAELTIGGKHQFGASFENVTQQQAEYSLSMIAELQLESENTVKLLLDQTTFTVTENTPPTVQIVSPTNGSIINSRRKSAEISAEDAFSIKYVDARIGSSEWFKLAESLVDGGRYYLSLDNLNDGSYQLFARAMDENDNISNSVSTQFIVDNTPPKIEHINLSEGQIFDAAVIPEVVVTDQNLDSWKAAINGQPLQQGTQVSEFGFYRLVVEAFDLAGNSARSEINFEIRETLPPPPPPPVALEAKDDELTMSRGVWGTVDLLANDQFADINNIEVALLIQPKFGRLVETSKGTYNYFPDLRYVGVDSFSYQLTDTSANKVVSAVVNIDISPAASCSFVRDHSTRTEQRVELERWARNTTDSDETPSYKISILGTSNDDAFTATGLPTISFPECSLIYTPDSAIRQTVTVQYQVKDVRTNGDTYTSPIRQFVLNIDNREGQGQVIVPIINLLLMDNEEK